MKLLSRRDAAMTPVDAATGTTMSTLIGPDDGPARFATRRFVIAPGGRIPAHSHADTEHEQVVVAGEIHLTLDGEPLVARPGDAIFIPAGTVHAYENRGFTDAEFICVIPNTDGTETTWYGENDR
jgi:quercetin dioxygenase-like cupin family protein